MSGIGGLFNQDGAPVAAEDLRRMAALLERRGPEATGLWRGGPAGLVHTLLATTPEALVERQPLEDPASGCVISADVRLDNRAELLKRLDLSERADIIGDAEIVLAAYVAWGETCVDSFLGDFVFAIRDPRRNRLFCARDHLGLRPLYYHHAPGRFLAFASEPRAILALPQASCRINEGRIADFLVNPLEGIDKTSTFFEEVYRLPPAHTLTVTPNEVQIRRYWRPEPGPELRLTSNEEYAEAFLEVFTVAVRCRLRGAGPVGSMLSGGMDSGSVVAVAQRLLFDQGQGPLPTFSAVGPDPSTCVETRAIQAALTMPGLEPHLVRRDRLDALMPELEELTWSLDEPFDNHMTLPRAMYLTAHHDGVNVLLDGIGGDIVLGEGNHLARLLRTGHWFRAYREAVEQNRFWGGGFPPFRELCRKARTAFIPDPLRRLRARLTGTQREKRRVRRTIQKSLISPDFARRVDLARRLRVLDGHSRGGLAPSDGIERAAAIDHPFLTVGRERYDRVASAVAVEPRDPFLDLRVVAFCMALPGSQKLDGGWPKAILRRAMAGRLPDAVRRRRGKEHLGWEFTAALMRRMPERIRVALERDPEGLSRYVDRRKLSATLGAWPDRFDPADGEGVYDMAHLASWLHRHGR